MVNNKGITSRNRIILSSQMTQAEGAPADSKDPGTQEGFISNQWQWSPSHKSPEVTLSQDGTAAFFHVNHMLESKGTAGVRGNKGFCEGEHYWEVIFSEPPIGTSVMVGIGTSKAKLHTDNFVNLIGEDKESWGLSYKGKLWHNGQSRTYCVPWYNEATVIGVHLNMYAGTLSFYLNGQPLGVAFRDLNPTEEMLYPIIASTAEGSEIFLGKRVSRYLTLQEKCFDTIAKSLKCKTDIDTLPLPVCVKKHLHSIT